jgi:hypothetical protein
MPRGQQKLSDYRSFFALLVMSLNFCTKTCGKAERRKEKYDSELNIENRGFNSLIS